MEHMALVETGLVATKRWALLSLTVLGALIVAGCSTGQATATSTTSTTTTTLNTTTTSTTVASGPPLGLLAGIFAQGKGFGEVEPSEFYNGGDPTGLVTHIVWKSWGEPKAIGTGVSEYVAPNQDVGDGTEQPATVVAFRLRNCFGDHVYEAVEWYFPQHGQSFNPDQYENICTGAFITSTTTAPTCPPGHMRVATGPLVGGATGEMSMTIVLANNGPSTCVLDGYPEVRLLTATGKTLSFSQATSSQYIRKIPPRRVVLGVGALAYIEIAKYRCDLGVAKSATQVQLALPGTPQGAAFVVPVVAIGSFSYCKGGPSDPGNAIAFTPVESTLGRAQP
jgi:hypothetical protein